jgi:hypothetical protein
MTTAFDFMRKFRGAAYRNRQGMASQKNLSISIGQTDDDQTA